MIGQDPPAEFETEQSGLAARYEDIAHAVCARLARNQRVRRNLPSDGRLRIDRQLPFLCIYRTPPDRDDAGTVELVTTEAAYLFAAGADEHLDGMTKLCQRINSAMQEHFGTFLILEIWSQPSTSFLPEFEIVSADCASIPLTIEAFRTALSEINVIRRLPGISVRDVESVSPPGLRPVKTAGDESGTAGCCVLGLAVNPIYRDSATGVVYPLVLQNLRQQLAVAIRKTVAQFTGTASDSKSDNGVVPCVDSLSWQSLGPSSLVKAARLIDQQLSEVSESFDFLLQVTPTNAELARREFRDRGYSEAPQLRYRSLPYHPGILKRRLFNIEIERIEDPTLAYLFWEKQDEIDRKLTALRDLDSPTFLYSSLQLYGAADEPLVQMSQDLLESIPESVRASGAEEKKRVAAKELVEYAREEIDYYHTRMPEFNATVEECDEIAGGIMVSHDRLLVSRNLNMSAERVQPLLHHEIGTHLLTYFNGRCQPFRQLYAGLSGYEELQEGLAVLAEFLVGGLTSDRVRTLAGRVLAVHSLTDGGTFAETFELLHDRFGFAEHRAFTTTLRVYRGGGLTKDVIYLRGLRSLLQYLAAGHDIEPLYVGKIGLQHVPYVQEMRRRKIIVAPRILPRFLDDGKARQRLDACRNMSFVKLLETAR